jgi:hypothetical protein
MKKPVFMTGFFIRYSRSNRIAGLDLLANTKVGNSGAKEAHAGACSDKRQVLLGLDLSSEAAKIFQAASVASRLRVAQ